VASGGLVVHVRAGRRPVERAALQARHRLLLRPHGPRRHPDLKKEKYWELKPSL
jgi:hypothetical protein